MGPNLNHLQAHVEKCGASAAATAVSNGWTDWTDGKGRKNRNVLFSFGTSSSGRLIDSQSPYAAPHSAGAYALDMTLDGCGLFFSPPISYTEPL